MKKSIILITLFLLQILNSLYAQKLETLTSGGALLSKSAPPSDTIRMIPKDSVVRILSEPTAEGYVYVRYEGNDGYIKKDFLTVTTLPIDLSKYKLNQRDEKGKKDSLWIEYLDDYWRIVEDSNKAKYYRYAFYYHGRNVVGKPGFKKNWALHCTGDSTLKSNKPVALNGAYKWYSPKGSTMDYYYINGQRIWTIAHNSERHDTKTRKYAVVSTLDFRKKYKGEPFTATKQIVLRDGRSHTWYLRFDTVTWSYNEGVFF